MKTYELKNASGFVVGYVSAESVENALSERYPAVMAAEVHPPRVFCDFVKAHVACGMSLRDAVTRVRSAHAHLVAETMDYIGSWPSSDPIFRELQRQY